MARPIDKHLAERHAEHFDQSNRCPGCGQISAEPTQHKERPLQTEGGDMRLEEPAGH